MKSKLFLFLAALLLLCTCTRVPEKLEPKINYAMQDKYLKRLPSPFPPLSGAEKESAWGKEYTIGIAFAHQLDLYQSITAFKRAEILAPPEASTRKLEMNYEILLCYYLGGKYSDVVYAFENSDMRNVDTNFPAFHDLLVILYDSYTQLNQPEKAQRILETLQHYYPEAAEKLSLSTALSHADWPVIKSYEREFPYLKDFLNNYDSEKKSIGNAKILNAALPGAGYLYVGQRQAALTAFLLNGLFIAASYHFFHRGHVAAGIIFSSFEAGWYFGGIYGAGEEAKFYNERVYEKYATPLMNQQGLFPVLTLKYAF